MAMIQVQLASRLSLHTPQDRLQASYLSTTKGLQTCEICSMPARYIGVSDWITFGLIMHQIALRTRTHHVMNGSVKWQFLDIDTVLGSTRPLVLLTPQY